MNNILPTTLSVLLFLFISCNPSEKEITKTINNSQSKLKTNLEAELLYTQSKKQNIDSLHSKALMKLVGFYYTKKDWKLFHTYRLEHLNTLSLKKHVKTNAFILDYSGAFFRHHNVLDSAYHYYYRAYKTYHSLNDSLRAGNMLLNAAIVQKNSRDFTGSEATSFKALPFIETVKNERRIASIFNNLGIIYMCLEDFENAIKYHTKAYEIRKKLPKNRILELHSLNNIANVYKKKEAYNKAIPYYTKALSNYSNLQKSPGIKAKLIDNYAHAQFLNGNDREIPQLFFKALKIRDSIGDVSGKITSYIHLGEYYKKNGKKKMAQNFLEKAKKMAEAIKYHRDIIESMEMLSDIYPNNKALQTAKKIINLQDSIQKVDRIFKDQHARTRYETLKKEKIILQQEKELQKKELQINRKTISFLILLLIIIVTIFVFLVLWFKKYNQQQKFKFGFFKYLQEKYKLTPVNLEFWQELIKGYTEKELAEQLFISINSIKSRRKTLFAKIKYVIDNDNNFDKTKALILYKKELENYKKIAQEK